MAVTQLADIYNPLVFNPAVDEAAIELNAFLQSGVMVNSPLLDSMATVGGNIGELPFHDPLNTSTEPDYTTDDPSDLSVPQKITTSKMIYRLASMHGSWSTMDLTRELALMDPMAAITRKVGKWWSTQIEKRVIQSAMGVLADNVANDSGDMLYSVATDDVAAIADAERISAEVVLTAKQTMGDHADALSVLAVHSVLYTKLQSLNLIDYIPDARGEISFPSYLGYRLVVDDSLPAVAGTNRITYTSILFAQGAFDHGRGTTMIPSELERVQSAGYGGGQDIIHSRRADIIHPYGFSFVSASITGQSATLAELADATEWDRVVNDRKHVPMAFIQTNG